MDTVHIQIALDPINDGASFIPKETEVKNEGALIIATNGDHKIINEIEAAELLEKLSGYSRSEFLGKTPYMLVMHEKKVIRIADGQFFVGSALVLKSDRNGVAMLSGDDYEKAKWEFASRIVTLVCNGQEFSAYEIC